MDRHLHLDPIYPPLEYEMAGVYDTDFLQDEEIAEYLNMGFLIEDGGQLYHPDHWEVKKVLIGGKELDELEPKSATAKSWSKGDDLR